MACRALWGGRPELAALQQALERAGAGQGQVVAIVGEAGVGKSRLVYEVIHSHRTQGWLVLESASVSYGKATPYFPVLDLLKRYTQVEDRDDTRTIRARVTGQVLTLDEALQETIPALLWLLEALPEDHAFLTLEPPQRRRRTLEALKRVLVRESQVQPLLLVFEDLHWIDAETQALLDTLVESLPTARLLLLVNYRPEYQHGWGSKTYYTQLRLDPLPPVSAEVFLHALLGDDPSLAPLTRLLSARTGGNPFFLEESVRTLVETQVLVGEHGAYRLTQPLDSLQVPATVQAVLAARIDRLSPEEKRLLQTAAVIGTEVPFPLLQAIAALPEDELHRGLARLQAAEFLYETSLFPEPAYTFKHALTHEVAYGGLLQERRRTLHAGIVEASETLYRDRLSDQVERLAYHAVRGEVWEKALHYSRQAGARALARSANQEAVTYFEGALAALQHLPDSPERRAQAIDLRFDLRMALLPLGAFARIFALLQEALALAEAGHDQQRLGRAYRYLINQFLNMGDPVRALSRPASAPSPWPRASTTLPCSCTRALPSHGSMAIVATIGRRWTSVVTLLPRSRTTSLLQLFDALGLLPRVPGPMRPGAWRSWARLRRDSSMAVRRSRSPRPRMTSSVWPLPCGARAISTCCAVTSPTPSPCWPRVSTSARPARCTFFSPE